MARVTDLRCELYAIPTGEALDDATQSFDELELVVVRVETDAGTGGLGFTYTIGEGGDAIRAFVEEVLAPGLDGEFGDPLAADERGRRP